MSWFAPALLLVLLATAPAAAAGPHRATDGSLEAVAVVLGEARAAHLLRADAIDGHGTEEPAMRAIVEAPRPLPVQRSVLDHGLPAPRAPARG